MEIFNHLEFELPKDYLSVNKSNLNTFLNTTIGSLPSWLNEQQLELVSEGSQIILFKENKIVTNQGGNVVPIESIFITLGGREYPTMSEEEYVILQKNLKQVENDKLIKCEVSEFFNWAKFPIYKKIIDAYETTYYFHEFFLSEESNDIYSIQLNLNKNNDDPELSKENFDKILKSIKIKND